MKKKMNAKQKREEQKLKIREKYVSTKTTETTEQEVITESTTIETIKKIKVKKSSAKIAGLKSAFILSDKEVLMTSFGRGNNAVIEKYISENEIISLNNSPAFEAARENTTYCLTGRKKGKVDDPLRYNENGSSAKDDKVLKLPGMDILGLKPTLEKKFFNVSDGFSDNIHIQMIYSILDIEKILAPHINNISHVINNLRRDSAGSDFIGYMSLKNSYKTFLDPESSSLDTAKITNINNTRASFDRLISMPQRAYLGDALFNTKLKKGAKETEEDLKRYYYTISMIGEARQALFHGKENEQAHIYQFGPEYDNKDSWKNTDPTARIEARIVLDNIYANRVNELNNNFLDMAKKDLSLLFKILEADTTEKKSDIVRKYYDFIVRKDQKNLGFSLKKLREIILAGPDGMTISSGCEQSMRSKFVKCFDFTAALYYQKNPSMVETIVQTLRDASDENDREAVYHTEADNLWASIRNTVLNHILPAMNPDIFKNLKKDPDVSVTMLGDAIISTDAEYFSKFIYMLTQFMDGKEINDLLTQLISKFENIESFIQVMNERSIYGKLDEEYSMFDRSGKIADELRVINSFARMQSESPAAKKSMYLEAAQILGFNGTDDEMEDYLELILTKDPSIKAELQKKFSKLPRPNKGLRNFIANNVLESSRFKYLVRYADPAKVKELAKNDQVLKLVLNEIPDEQILKYYISAVSENAASPETMRDELRRILRSLTFTDFSDVDQSSNAERNIDKQKKQAVIRLYLTVLYLAVKNLVRVNSRYTLAFHCFERDYQLFTGKKFNNIGQYTLLTQKFIDEKRLNKKSRAYLAVNIANADTQVIRIFRNNVAHLSVIENINTLLTGIKKTDSYFALYHYLIQKKLMNDCTATLKMDSVNAATCGFFESVELYGKYRKDFIKALNVPFGYNLARYKNLSIEGLFDMNNPSDAGTSEPDGE